MTMIERVARAIDPTAFAKLEAAKFLKFDARLTQWQNRVNDAHKLARAAIEAMREPSDAMVDAAWASWEDVEGSKGFVGAWQAMIDEALK